MTRMMQRGARPIVAAALIQTGAHADHTLNATLPPSAAAAQTIAAPPSASARVGWLAAFVLSRLPFIGYVLSHSTGLPGGTGDIGNWTERLGLASLYMAACICALGLYGLALLGSARADPLERGEGRWTG